MHGCTLVDLKNCRMMWGPSRGLNAWAKLLLTQFLTFSITMRHQALSSHNISLPRVLNFQILWRSARFFCRRREKPTSVSRHSPSPIRPRQSCAHTQHRYIQPMVFPPPKHSLTSTSFLLLTQSQGPRPNSPNINPLLHRLTNPLLNSPPPTILAKSSLHSHHPTVS